MHFIPVKLFVPVGAKCLRLSSLCLSRMALGRGTRVALVLSGVLPSADAPRQLLGQRGSEVCSCGPHRAQSPPTPLPTPTLPAVRNYSYVTVQQRIELHKLSSL